MVRNFRRKSLLVLRCCVCEQHILMIAMVRMVATMRLNTMMGTVMVAMLAMEHMEASEVVACHVVEACEVWVTAE